MVGSLSQAWELARAQVKKAQQKQKKYYDLHTKESKFQQGDCVFVYMPSEKKKKGKAHKFARPFHGPYRVIESTANDAKVVPVDKPHCHKATKIGLLCIVVQFLLPWTEFVTVQMSSLLINPGPLDVKLRST